MAPNPAADWRLGALAGLLLCAACTGQTLTELPLKNASFEDGAADSGVPVNWSRYGGAGKDQQLKLLATASHGQSALLIADGDPAAEIGVHQTFPLKPDETYEVRAMVRRVKGASPSGAYLQFRFLPSQKLVQTGLAAASADRFDQVSVRGTAPAGTTGAVVYLYTHKTPTPKVIVDDVKLIAGFPPPPPPPPDPVPPVYDKLKDLHLTTHLVKDGTPAVAIVAPASGLYDTPAKLIQEAIRRRTNVTVPVVTDGSPVASVPIRQNLILLGNRSTNRAINTLYDLYYCLLDLKYPGPAGHVLRTLHDPFGDGLNVVFVGGSDAEGVASAAEAFSARLPDPTDTPPTGELSIGRLQDIELGRGVTVPSEIRQYETWEASAGYGSVGYFGWSSLSKRLAMYYMTGEEFHAREFVRLAFPDAKAIRDIEEIDGERIENKKEPLRGPYHYNAHMMVLYWDLVEDSPAFTDEERLHITNAFATQLAKRAPEGIYRLTAPSAAVGSRHGQWSAVSLYCLGRYFQKNYPDPRWSQCVRGAVNHFGSLHKYAWVNGESDNLFWYNTGIAPIFTYMVLTGDRKPLENGVLQTLLRGQEALLSGANNDAHLRSASLGYLHKAAYLTGDGRWITYRERTGMDTDVFRLGQSFWPGPDLPSNPPTDLAGTWLINPVPGPLWERRGSDIPPEHSFFFGSYRSTADDSGDYVLLDGFNGASRNPYHTLALLHLRLDGATLLRGFRNQVLTSADGMVEPKVAMNAALRYRNVLGPTAIAVGEVPKAAFCNWRRSLLQRTGEYSLIVDELTFRADSQNMEVRTLWETVGGSWSPERNSIRFSGARGGGPPPGWLGFKSLEATCRTQPSGPEDVVRLVGIGVTLLRAREPGSWIEMPFTLDGPLKGELFVDLVNYQDRGTVAFALDGKPVGKPYDHHAQSVVKDRVPLGAFSLTPGEHRLRVEAQACHSGVDRCYVGLAGVTIRPEGAPDGDGATTVELTPADDVSARGRDSVTMLWTGSAQEGETRRFFYLIAPATAASTPSTACLRLDGKAAALRVPSPAVAVVQEYKGLKGELVLLSAAHLHGHGLEQAPWQGLLRASRPVDLDWGFGSGSLHIEAKDPVELTVALASAEQLRSAGKPVKTRSTSDGRVVFTLAAGRHEMANAVPSADVLTNLTRRLEAEHAAATRLAAAAREGAPTAEAPTQPINPSMEAKLEGSVLELSALRWRGEEVLCAVSGKTASLVTGDGRVAAALEADANIRTAHWWAEHDLLLLGCVDEKIIAYAENGSRAWEFVSKMDPAVYRAAKTYWFKTAPGHAGVHALHTGKFLDGKSQCFAGSACTLEIIDERGQLLKRLPVFWGPGHKFALVDGPNDAVRLLIAREPTDSHALAIVDNKKLSVGRGFYGVPAGHTYVGGWACMTRDHIFYDDVNADGKPEIVSEINGTWNRVTVWDERGTALHSAQFGPGRRIPARNMRDVDIGDLDGDGRKEILVATAPGLVVALTCRCEKLWSRRFESPPCLLAYVARGTAPSPHVLVACEDGTVHVLDAGGQPVGKTRISGRPTSLGKNAFGDSGTVALGTSKGQLTTFQCP